MIYVMSDIHGNHTRFHSVMDQIGLTDEDSFILKMSVNVHNITCFNIPINGTNSLINSAQLNSLLTFIALSEYNKHENILLVVYKL